MSGSTLDRETLQAVGVLKRAVDEARVPGVLEFRLLSSALDRTLETEDLHELNEAKRVYETLDGECRTLVVERATFLAHAEVAERRAPPAEVADEVVADALAAAAGPQSPAPPPGLRGGRAMRPATGFLAALNGVRHAARVPPPADGPPDSRVTAKSRLMAAVEERRENDQALRDRSGEPAPNADRHG
ncbi:hypothetical protein DS843_27160 [Roseomonas genomospecies 6]|uniref:Uncharacterized protein n=2 Tax=Roseomonas genomospecies 6 TaxID=214106 RepID=A0A9W7NFI4_9PROT|nr:hypothetical protein DS843_27160 [Roseomonas genomospecies 6]